jgi:undecaprenyl-diphosphatase
VRGIFTLNLVLGGGGAYTCCERYAAIAMLLPAGVAERPARSTGPAATLPGMTAPTIDRATESAVAAAHDATVPTHVALSRGRAANAVALACLGGFVAVFAAVRTHRSEAFDAAVMLKLQRRSRPGVDRVMAAASWLGFPPQSRIVPPALIGMLYLLRFRVEAGFQLLGWSTGFVSTVLKSVMRRPRPVAGTDLRVVAAPLGGSSFPSGHVITYVGTYGFLAYLAHTLIRPVAPRRAIVGALLGLIALVGPSRIYEGHHWPTDVTASYLLGTTWLVGLAALYRRAKDATPSSRGLAGSRRPSTAAEVS